MKRRLDFRSLGLLAAGFVLLASPAAAQSRQRTPVSPSSERGRQVAERVCSACHAITLEGASPSAMAPPFRALRMRYNPLSLERHIGALATAGYYGMPPQRLATGEAEAVAAYIDTLHGP